MGGLEFWGYKEDDNNPTKVIIAEVDKNPRTWLSFDPTFDPDPAKDERYIGGNYYDAEKDTWGTYTVSHKYFATKEMFFENKTNSLK